MIPGMNARDMQKAMKRLGIQQQELDAHEVVIKLADKELVIRNPSVAKVNMMGQETFQISGEIEERSASAEPEINDEDVKTVMEQTGKPREDVEAAIAKHHGDLAAAILELQP
ncbi:nascent polypeptide-associated complex protein [Candidatus Woesearchaeota archaeon]|nr:nascent polypeptide-associated complex protein [Candidatus Woesearchaeota archaeon]